MALDQLKQKLSTTFNWSSKPLTLGGIGCPLVHVEHLMEGTFQQQLSEGMKRSAAKSLNLFREKDFELDPFEGQNLTSSNIQEQQISVNALSPDERKKVEDVLSKLSEDITRRLDLRLSITPMMNACMNVFNKTEWYDTDVNASSKAEEKMKELLNELGRDDFVIETLLPGYISFLDYKTKCESSSLRVEDVYQSFFNLNKKSIDIAPFISLFEFINIKSFSEAYCESVGSLMNILVNKGRNLSSANFSKELIFSFNVPPLHVLANKFIPEIVDCLVNDKKKQFFRKLDSSDQKNKLKFQVVSSSLGNYRKDSDNKAHLPICFF